MSVLGRWWGSGRRSDQRKGSDDAASPDPGSSRSGGPSPVASPEWGPVDEVDLGPAPPPDAADNHGPPTGPLPVIAPSSDPGADDVVPEDPAPAPARGDDAADSAALGGPLAPTSPAPPLPYTPAPNAPGPWTPAGGIPASAAPPPWARSARGGPPGSVEPPWRRPGPPRTAAGTPPPSGPPASGPPASGPPASGPSAPPTPPGPWTPAAGRSTASGQASPSPDPGRGANMTSSSDDRPADAPTTPAAPVPRELGWFETRSTPTAATGAVDADPTGDDPTADDPTGDGPSDEQVAAAAAELPAEESVPATALVPELSEPDATPEYAGGPVPTDDDIPAAPLATAPDAAPETATHPGPATDEDDAVTTTVDTTTTTTGATPVPTRVATVGSATAPDVPVDRAALAQGRLGVDDVTPEVSGGRFPSKAVVGEVVPVSALVWREGHDAVAATVVWQRCSHPGHGDPGPAGECGDEAPRRVRMVSAGPETDRFVGAIAPDAEGLWSFRVDAWSDPWATWRHAVEAKVEAGQGPAELANDLETGARLLDRGARGIQDRFRTEPDDAATATMAKVDSGRTAPIELPPALTLAQALTRAAAALRDRSRDLPARLGPALSEPVHRTMVEQPVRELVTPGHTHHVVVERSRALEGAWYEFFPRSTGGRDADGTPVHGTFATAARELERVAAMGFDVAYLPPIHPVGTVNRKGANNTLTPGPEDVGSPWAIGSAAGGHDAVDPHLGTLEDFDAFVDRARELGLEVALDLALQCAPDHPWAAAHPEWFTVRPDGTIAYAENPPKKYQDIYPVNFDTDPEGIYREVLRVVLGWIDHGVRIFRVDNPHTKPPDFWAWLIAEVHRRDPGVVFLAEAFTRPARLFGLAKLGFSQSYTYFTWRTGKQELTEFFETHRDRIDEARPNCFVNTPDILHESLQVGGPGMFALRAALAATLSPSWGVYAGFELFEGQAVRPGSEEYLDSEKYQLRPRDFAGALAAGRSLEPWLTRLNEIRRAHPALRQIRSLRFHDVDNPALLAYSKTDPATGDVVVCVVTLNPFGPEEGTLRLDVEALGLGVGERFAAVDEVSGETFDWGPANYVRLEPWRDVAHIVSVVRR